MNALYQMVPCPMTLMDPNPDFKVTAFLKLNISETVCLRDKVAREH